jgi:hypothetical protein
MNKIHAIVSLWGKDCLLDEDGTLTIEGDVPTSQELSEITAEVTRLQAEYDSQAYARSRKQEYDKLNQWEMQFDDNRDGTTTWVDSINEIKSQFPKG